MVISQFCKVGKLVTGTRLVELKKVDSKRVNLALGRVMFFFFKKKYNRTSDTYKVKYTFIYGNLHDGKFKLNKYFNEENKKKNKINK